MEGIGFWLQGKERFCMRRNLEELGLGTRDRGEVWKGPIKEISSSREKGPIYRDWENSLFTNVTNSLYS